MSSVLALDIATPVVIGGVAAATATISSLAASIALIVVAKFQIAAALGCGAPSAQPIGKS